MHEMVHEEAVCAYNSPVSGLCSGRSSTASVAAVAEQPLRHALRIKQSQIKDVFKGGSQTPQPHSLRSIRPGGSGAGPMSWTPTANKALISSTNSMPELWQTPEHLHAAEQQQQQQHAGDRQLLRDQHPGMLLPSQQIQGEANIATHPQQVKQQPTPPLEVLLAPLLPSADEGKLAERLSQLRVSLGESRHLASSWEQQAAALQHALAYCQQENHGLRSQLVSAQQHIALLGGNLQGRLSLVQGSVLAQMQEQLAEKDAALAAGQQQVCVIQAELERLSCSFAAKLAAEQTERERLAAEASQARLLCMARGRQVTSLQQEMEQLQQRTSQQQDSAATAAGLQQQQLEELHQQLQQLQAEVAAARGTVAASEQQVAASEGGKAALRQQVEELQGLLAEKQLQVEWLEGKVADLEGSDVHQQFKRHSSELSRIQAAAAAERQALEQQLSSAQRQLAQLQQQEVAQQQELQQLAQQCELLQQQLQGSQEAQLDAAEQVQELAQHLQQAEGELQQLQCELEAVQAHSESAGNQQQQQQQEIRQHQDDENGVAMASDADDCDGDDDDHAASAGAADDAELHALRAQLGMARAEVARLRHELDVSTASQTHERQLTGQEILRLQQELTEAAAAADSSASGSMGIGSCRRSINSIGCREDRQAAEAAAAASDDEGDGFEVASGAAQHQLQGAVERAVCKANEIREEDESEAWKLVHYNPAFEQPKPAATAAEGKWQGTKEAAAAAAAVKEHGELICAGHEAVDSSTDIQLPQYELRLQDQADTIASLQQQLKQQQLLLAAMQRRDRRVYDSAASRSSWVDVLGLEQQQQHDAAAATTTGNPVAPAPAAALVADAAVQTEGLATESAGSTAAAPAGGYEVTSPAAATNAAYEHACRHHSHHQQQQQGDVLSEVAAGNALLAAARHEILRLQELNQQLLLTHAEELKSSVSFDDARRAVAEAKQHAKSKAAAVLKEHSRSWSDKLAAVRAQRQQLMQQLQQLQQERDQLAAQGACCGHCEAAQQAMQELQQQLKAAHQHVQQLQSQMAALLVGHAQELEQARMDAEADAAAAMLDAAAAARASASRAPQRQEQAVQVDLQQQQQQQQAASLTDAEVQTDAQQEQQDCARASPACGCSGQAEGREQQQHRLLQEQQQQHDEPSGPASPAAVMPAAAVILPVADVRPCTPQPAAAVSTAAGAAAHIAAAEPAAGAAESPAVAQPDSVHSFVQPWHTAAASSTADVGEDDLCRMSSASDTPVTAANKLQGSSSQADLCMASGGGEVGGAAAAAAPGQGAAGGAAAVVAAAAAAAAAASAAGGCFVDAVAAAAAAAASVSTPRPDTAGTGGLPELTESTSPVAAVSYSKLLPPGDTRWRPLQQEQQQQQQPLPQLLQHEQCRPLQQQQQQQQQQHAGAVKLDNVAQLSEWHVELLQQQAQLDLLKLRLSQHQQVHSGSLTSQRQQQQPRVQVGNRYSALAAAGAGAATPAPAAAAAAAVPLYGEPFLALNRTSAAAQPGAAAAAGRAVLGSPAGPISSSSPLSFAQRRQQQQQEQSSRRDNWQVSRLSSSHDRPDRHLLTTPVLSPGVAAPDGAASHHGLYDTLYSSNSKGAPVPAAGVGVAAGAGASGASPPYTRVSCSYPDTTRVKLWDMAAGATVGSHGRHVPVGSSNHWQQQQQQYLPGPTAEKSFISSTSNSLTSSTAGIIGTAAAAAAAAAVSGNADSLPGGSGLVALGADVMGALSLSRIHKERSKLQEERAKQHALMAAHHEGQAAALRSSRLCGGSDTTNAATTAAPSAGNSGLAGGFAGACSR